ncbi:hypothetical protein CTheo_8843 [Ceratobasidium theobromae]|uniref:Uncharacterized protein n=1 Tax=Ceratobasidium theobromae TaxID=1582974 RepID=A0A5N5Q8H8_9AGAM|nr:hypothetical protein CTheo_8843 [Ceratobasidium theobromae]
MAKQILPIVAGKATPETTQLIRAILDFIYRAHGASLTDKDLEQLEASRLVLHDLKEILISEGCYTTEDRFDKIPKLHMMGHYAHSIRELGTPDGYNTEGPEHLHIEYVKKPWRASNKREPLPQMTKYLQRLDAIRLQRRCMDAFYGSPKLDEKEDVQDDSYGTSAEEGEVGSQAEVYSESDPFSVVYPSPRVHLPKTPTKRRIRAQHLICTYGATELFPAIVDCLRTRFQASPTKLTYSPRIVSTSGTAFTYTISLFPSHHLSQRVGMLFAYYRAL